jgi:hypothetical protein
MFEFRNGYYNDSGYWTKTKHCFVSCGSRCDCGPPGGQYYSERHDKKLFQKAIEERKDAVAQGESPVVDVPDLPAVSTDPRQR